LQAINEKKYLFYFFFLPADFFAADFFTADFFGADFLDAVFFAVDFFAADFFGADFLLADFFDAAFFGTFAPSFLASESPMAIACSRLLTLPPFPPGPERSFPSFFSCITSSTFSCAFFEYLAVTFYLKVIKKGSFCGRLTIEERLKLKLKKNF
jgi:uncharacterized protein YjbI with pentapeptide repeats